MSPMSHNLNVLHQFVTYLLGSLPISVKELVNLLEKAVHLFFEWLLRKMPVHIYSNISVSHPRKSYRLMPPVTTNKRFGYYSIHHKQMYSIKT